MQPLWKPVWSFLKIIKNRATVGPSNPSSGHLPAKSICKGMRTAVLPAALFYGHNTEAVEVSFTRGLGKVDVVHTHNGTEPLYLPVYLSFSPSISSKQTFRILTEIVFNIGINLEKMLMMSTSLTILCIPIYEHAISLQLFEVLINFLHWCFRVFSVEDLRIFEYICSPIFNFLKSHCKENFK